MKSYFFELSFVGNDLKKQKCVDKTNINNPGFMIFDLGKTITSKKSDLEFYFGEGNADSESILLASTSFHAWMTFEQAMLSGIERMCINAIRNAATVDVDVSFNVIALADNQPMRQTMTAQTITPQTPNPTPSLNSPVTTTTTTTTTRSISVAEPTTTTLNDGNGDPTPPPNSQSSVLSSSSSSRSGVSITSPETATQTETQTRRKTETEITTDMTTEEEDEVQSSPRAAIEPIASAAAERNLLGIVVGSLVAAAAVLTLAIFSAMWLKRRKTEKAKKAQAKGGDAALAPVNAIYGETSFANIS